MIKIPSFLDGFTSKADKTAGLRFSSLELNDEDFTILRKHQGLMGWLVFSEQQLQDSDIPKEKIEDKSKAPSKRFRSVLYLYFIQQGGKKENFETYYAKVLESLIDNYKEKLND